MKPRAGKARIGVVVLEEPPHEGSSEKYRQKRALGKNGGRPYLTPELDDEAVQALLHSPMKD
jgi:hypothetical protein